MDSDDEELDRSDADEINLEQVSVKSVKSGQSAKQKAAILSPEEVEEI